MMVAVRRPRGKAGELLNQSGALLMERAGTGGGRRARHLLAALVALSAPAAPAGEVPARNPLRASATSGVYQRAAPAIVGIVCGGEQGTYGTGVLIDPSGLVLTTVTVVPRAATRIRVHLRGGAELAARIVLINEEKELALIRVGAPGEKREFPHLKLGDSAAARPGHTALTFGNAFHSIEHDDQVTMAEGLVSGVYQVSASDLVSESKYTGPVLETSAAVNDGMDGGPLLDREGRIIGLLSLAYSKNRWLGTAIPVNDLKPLIAAERGWFHDRREEVAAFAGIELEEVARSEVRILRVEPDGPAARAGLVAGERILSIGGKRVESLAAFRAEFAAASPGGKLALEVEPAMGGSPRPVEVRLWGMF
jgi:serine protease Do